MTERPTSELDAFEARLLNQLKVVVAAQASDTQPLASPTTNGRRRPRTSYVFAAGVAAAAVGIAVLATVAQPTPAYAVTGGNGEEVTVRVMRLEGAGALEEALRERGIPADITYLSPGTACAPGRYDDVSSSGLSLSVSADRFEVTIPAGAVEEGNTFVMSAAVQPTENGARSTVDFGIAEATVGPCTMIAAS